MVIIYKTQLQKKKKISLLWVKKKMKEGILFHLEWEYIFTPWKEHQF